MLSTEQERKQNYLISEHAKINPRLPPLKFQINSRGVEFYSHLGGYNLKFEFFPTNTWFYPKYKFSIIGSEFLSRRAHSLIITSEIQYDSRKEVAHSKYELICEKDNYSVKMMHFVTATFCVKKIEVIY